MNSKIITSKEEKLKPEEVAELLRVSEMTIKRWLKNGKLKGTRINERGDWRILKSDLESYLNEINI